MTSMYIRSLFVSVLVVCALLAGGFLVNTISTFAPLRIVFFDVGQGDAILISEGNTQVLIDGGRDGKILLGKLGSFLPFWDRDIEVMIATHPDADHIGGLPSALRRYRVNHFLDNGSKSESDIYQDLQRSIEESSTTERSVLGAGSRIVFPGGAVLSVLFPENGLANTYHETNKGSIVARLDYKEESFLFTGDLPQEETVLPGIKTIRVLKVAHHGSRYSTSAKWLSLVSPREAVVSVGKNRYGHPASEVIDRLRQAGVQVIRTDQGGDIIYSCRQTLCQRQEN